ncbi:hypothetical protein ZEAMMB73_Zm00001d046323 [Zea mays]|uniref:Uncharacterized protein n=1 Tax=Zea mays TaxID=4577 RepID=A0A1D6P231_MAIZE|nr:hypothetical protein ZEAMMB73_Zm00001d046323 [Zea mays]
MGRPSRGRQRIEIRHIEDGGRLQVTFSKRKSGLQKKASELFLLCGSPVAIVIFSPGKKVFALGTPSVDHVLRRYAPIPGEEEEDGLLPVLQDTDDVSAITDRVEVEGIVRRTEETKARSVMEKARMDAIGKTVRQTAAKAGRKFWWEADSGKLGEAELPEFAKIKMTEPSSSYSLPSKKRQRSPDDNEHSLDRGRICLSLDDNLTFNDTMIALQLMRTQFPKLDKVLAQPFILQSQLYSSVKDRTQVDRDLESFKKDKVLRIFKLSSGQDDHAIMFMDDYLKQVAKREGEGTMVEDVVLDIVVINVAVESTNVKVSFAIKRSGGKDQDGSEVFEWFERYVVPSKLDVSITQLELCSLLSQGGDVTDKHITLLMNAGLLTRQLIDPNIYWFSIPRIGPILKGLSQGRNEILSLLNRRKYKEMPLSSLENTKLRLSPLDTRFLLRDLIGSGHIKTVQTPTAFNMTPTRR